MWNNSKGMNRHAIREELENSLVKENWLQCSRALFVLFYGIPAEIQLRAALNVARRAVRFCKLGKRQRDGLIITLGDVAGWVQLHGPRPLWADEFDEPENSAVTTVFAAVRSLIIAWYYRDANFQSTITSGAVQSIVDSIEAQATQCWIDSDPEAHTDWLRNRLKANRSVLHNAAANLARQREWRRLLRWINRVRVSQLPPSGSETDCNVERNRWEVEGILVPPSYRMDLEKSGLLES